MLGGGVDACVRRCDLGEGLQMVSTGDGEG